MVTRASCDALLQNKWLQAGRLPQNVRPLVLPRHEADSGDRLPCGFASALRAGYSTLLLFQPLFVRLRCRSFHFCGRLLTPVFTDLVK